MKTRPPLAALALAALLSVAAPAQADSDDPVPARETPRWFSSYWKPASAKGVETRVESVRVDDLPALRLHYAFDEGGGRYVGAYLHSSVHVPFDELRLAVRADTPGRVLVRFFDADGEVVQYAIPVKTAGEWIDLRVELDRPSTTFANRQGAILNRKVDFPLSGIFVGLEVERGTEAQGDLLFRGAELVR